MRPPIPACLLTLCLTSWTASTLAQTPAAAAAPSGTALSAELKAKILETMRFNRQTFQEPSVLRRYAEQRPSKDHPALLACDLPRTSNGDPAAQYPSSTARATPRPYPEVSIIDCLSKKGGLAGTRLKPLAQHYYCALPGFSPDIRGCFTFQLRLTSVSPARSAVDDFGYLPDGTRLKLEKGWNFLGPDPNRVPDIATAFGYCATDGRPHWIKNPQTGAGLAVSTIHPTPTRPTCWIAQTQADIFKGIMSGVIDPPVAEQVALLREYYECGKIKPKVSAKRYKEFCEIDIRGWE